MNCVQTSTKRQYMEFNNSHGGKRENSGRKYLGPTKVIRVHTELLPIIERLKSGIGTEVKETLPPILIELQRKYDLEHSKNLELTAKLHAMQSIVDGADRLKTEIAEVEKLAQTRLGQINRLRDKIARLESELKSLQKSR